MAEQTKCTGNCMACTIFQRQYCASQLAYSNMRMMEQMQTTIVDMQKTVNNLQEKIEAMQNNEALLFNPTKAEATLQQTGQPAAAAPKPPIAQ